MGNSGFIYFVVAKKFCITKQHIFSIQLCHQTVIILHITLPNLMYIVQNKTLVHKMKQNNRGHTHQQSNPMNKMAGKKKLDQSLLHHS